MKTLFHYLPLLLCLLLAQTARTQDAKEVDKKTDLTKQVDNNDRTVNDMFNRQDPSAALQSGGAFFVSNPSPAIELDPKLAYYRTDWQPLVIRLMSGETVELTGRYRIFDQKFEVKTDEGIFEMRNNMIMEAQLGDDYFKVIKTFGSDDIVQVYCKTPEYWFVGVHSAKLEDPKTKNMFDTSEDVRTLKRKRQLFLINNDDVRISLKNKRQVLLMLGAHKGSRAERYAKKEKLKLTEPADIVRLITFIEGEKS